MLTMEERKEQLEFFDIWWKDEGSIGPNKEDMHIYDMSEWAEKKAREAWLVSASTTDGMNEMKAYAVHKEEEEQSWS